MLFFFTTRRAYGILERNKTNQPKSRLFRIFCEMRACSMDIQLRPPFPKSIEKYLLFGVKQFWVGQNSPFKIWFVLLLSSILKKRGLFYAKKYCIETMYRSFAVCFNMAVYPFIFGVSLPHEEPAGFWERAYF